MDGEKGLREGGEGVEPGLAFLVKLSWNQQPLFLEIV